MQLILAIALLLLLASPDAWAATYYLATNGSNSNNCTAAQNPSTPKLTFKGGTGLLSCFATGDTPGNTSGAGHTIIATAGTYTGEDLVDVLPGGTSGSRFTILCASITYPSTPACILQPSSSSSHGIQVQFSNYVTFDGWMIDGSNLTHSCIFNYATGFEFKRGKLYNAFYSGLYNEGTGALYEDVTLERNGTRNTAYFPQFGGPNDAYIPGNDNILRRVRVIDGSAGVAFWHDNENPSGNLLIDSYIGRGLAGVPGRTRGGGGGLYKGTNNQIINTVFDQTGIWIQFGCTGCKVINSTIWNHQQFEGYGVLIDATVSNTVLQNLINCGHATGAVSNGGTNTTQTTNLTTCPSFVSTAGADFRLVNEDNGGTAAGAPSTDMLGVTRGTPPDRGCCEFVTLDQPGGSMSGPGFKRHKGSIQGPAGPFDF